MSAYRYIVFPVGFTPNADEMAALRRYAEHLNNHIALGHRRDGGLAIAFEAEPFDRLRGLEPAFEDLLTRWRARGGEIAEKLSFVKDSKVWKALDKAPKSTATSPVANRSLPSDGPPRESRDARVDGREAEGRSRLAVSQITAQSEQLERAAGWMPYALWGLGALLIMGAGVYLGSRLTSSESETRAATVERVADDPISQSLTPAAPE
jgi:hypothetical protein